MVMHRRGKKYAGQDRWEKDVLDVRRIAEKPRVGQDTRISGSAVRFDLVMIVDILRRREYGTENDALKSRNYDPTRVNKGGMVKPTLNALTGEWEYPVVQAQGNDTIVEGAALRGLSATLEAKWVTNEFGQLVRAEDWRRHLQPDPVGKTIEELLEQLAIAAKAMREFEKKLGIILNAKDAAKEASRRDGHCAACKKAVSGDGEDRLKAGYGACCYSAWRRWSAKQDFDGVDQSHVVFQRVRLDYLDARRKLSEQDAGAVTGTVGDDAELGSWSHMLDQDWSLDYAPAP